MTKLCTKTGMTKQNFYRARKSRQRRELDEMHLVQLVKRERMEQPRIGTRKLYGMLKEELAQSGVVIGRDRFFEVLRKHDLLVEPLKSEPKTTNSRHCLPVFKNLIQDLEVKAPNEVWVSDITYVRTDQGFVYLALIMDLFSRKIVGYHCGDTLEASGCIAALKMALRTLPKGARPIHHSDRGSQYCCHAYVECLGSLPISMTEVNHCYENAHAERLNGILKQEYCLGYTLRSKKHAYALAKQAVHLYNHKRPHTSLNFQVPEAVHKTSA